MHQKKHKVNWFIKSRENTLRWAFTLVELIVVVTILALLSTIWFIAYVWHLKWIRNTNRITTLVSLWEWLNSYKVNYSLPLPDDYVEVKVGWKIIAYQWYVWKSILKTIKFSNKWKDPIDDTYYSYYLTEQNNHFQLMWFLEKEKNITTASLFKETLALDYSIRYPSVYWWRLGILTDDNNMPVQEIPSILSAWKIELDTTNSWTLYTAYIKNWKTYSFSWRILANKLATLSEPWIYGPPNDCPKWFIAAWWDAGFNQEWFCVAQYEMTYTEEDSPWIPNSYDWTNEFNSYAFDNDGDILSGETNEWNWILETNEVWYGKKIASRAWDYPITDLDQWLAIDACKSMWKWYHLIMNSQWLSLTRQIEFEKENWSGWEVLNWFISTWVSDNTIYGCDPTDPAWYRTRSVKTWPWVDASCNEKRKHKLFNWQEIWDLAWNFWEHVNKANTLDGSWYSDGVTSLSTNTDTIDWSHADIDSIERWLFGPLIATNSEHWIWQIVGPNWTSDNVIVRWEDWYVSYPYGWIYTFALESPNAETSRIGFRCAYMK